MIHPHTELRFIRPEIGYGVVATRRIPKGTITWCLDALDRVFTPAEVAAMAPAYREILDKYTYRNAAGDHVLCWDHGRFVNHSFRPNCLPTPYEMELAVRDIEPGEELTDHYGALNIARPFEAVAEPGSRRRWVHPDEPLRRYRAWDRQLREAFELFNSVEQPLAPLILPRFRAEVEAVAAGRAPMGSSLETYYRDAAPPAAGRNGGRPAPAQVCAPDLAG